jgi:maleamate amidohydrolase
MSASDLTDLADGYAEAFGGRLQPGRGPAVVVIDLVRAYLEPSSPLYAGVEGILAPTAALVNAGRTAGIPVIFTNVRYRPDGADGGVFFRKIPALAVFAEDGPLSDFPDEPRPTDGDHVITKQYPSAFAGTCLDATLTSLGIDTLFLAGLSTSGCVRATAVDAISSGYVPLVVRDCVGDRDPRPHEASLFDLQAKYAEVWSLGEALAHLTEACPIND